MTSLLAALDLFRSPVEAALLGVGVAGVVWLAGKLLTWLPIS